MAKKMLLVANLAREHVIKFHIPTIQRFKENGWSVDVACSGDDVIPHCDHQYQMSWRRNPLNFRTVQGIFELHAILDREHYDIVYCHTPVGGLASRIASAIWHHTGTHIVYFAHGLHFYRGAHWSSWLLYYPVERYLSRFTDKMITSNEEDYLNVKTRFKKVKSVLLSNEVGVDLERFDLDDVEMTRTMYRNDLRISSDAIVLIYVAELTANKNQTMLLKLMQSLKSDNINIKLILVGPDHIKGFYQKQAVRYMIQDDVYFLGWRNDISELISTCDVYVASSFREGLGINLIEAMACGKPVVATNNRGHRSVIIDGENGYLVPINDHTLMAERIKKLAQDANLRDTISSSAFTSIQKYRQNVVLDTLYEFITQGVG